MTNKERLPNLIDKYGNNTKALAKVSAVVSLLDAELKNLNVDCSYNENALRIGKTKDCLLSKASPILFLRKDSLEDKIQDRLLALGKTEEAEILRLVKKKVLPVTVFEKSMAQLKIYHIYDINRAAGWRTYGRDRKNLGGGNKGSIVRRIASELGIDVNGRHPTFTWEEVNKIAGKLKSERLGRQSSGKKADKITPQDSKGKGIEKRILESICSASEGNLCYVEDLGKAIYEPNYPLPNARNNISAHVTNLRKKGHNIRFKIVEKDGILKRVCYLAKKDEDETINHASRIQVGTKTSQILALLRAGSKENPLSYDSLAEKVYGEATKKNNTRMRSAIVRLKNKLKTSGEVILSVFLNRESEGTGASRRGLYIVKKEKQVAEDPSAKTEDVPHRDAKEPSVVIPEEAATSDSGSSIDKPTQKPLKENSAKPQTETKDVSETPDAAVLSRKIKADLFRIFRARPSWDILKRLEFVSQIDPEEINHIHRMSRSHCDPHANGLENSPKKAEAFAALEKALRGFVGNGDERKKFIEQNKDLQIVFDVIKNVDSLQKLQALMFHLQKTF